MEEEKQSTVEDLVREYGQVMAERDQRRQMIEKLESEINELDDRRKQILEQTTTMLAAVQIPPFENRSIVVDGEVYILKLGFYGVDKRPEASIDIVKSLDIAY